MNVAQDRYNKGRETTMQKFHDALDKGLVDKMLIPFLLKYNKLNGTYTTSSCAGRIMLIGLDEIECKKPKLFIGKWHRKIKPKEVFDLLGTKGFDEIWLKQEPFIFHIVVKDLAGAEKVLNAKTNSGIKRGGIISLKPGKILLEIIGSHNMSLPIKIKNKILFDKEQLSVLINKANQKVSTNYKLLKKFENTLYKEMKKK